MYGRDTLSAGKSVQAETFGDLLLITAHTKLLAAFE
jgi:hypothetical protein